jgi:ribosomal protein L23
MNADKVLKLVRLTEKSNKPSAALGQYTFEVAPDANKPPWRTPSSRPSRSPSSA